MSRAFLAVLLALFTCASTACDARLEAACDGAFARKDWPVALEKCTAAFDRSGSIRAAANMSRADLELGHDEAVLEHARRLGEHPGAGALWLYSARVLQKRADLPGALAANQRAFAAFSAGGDHDGATRAAHALFRLHHGASRYQRSLEAAQWARDHGIASGDPELAETGLFAVFSALYELGDIDGAEAALQEASLKGRAEGRAYLVAKQALVQRARGRSPLARVLYEEAFQLATASSLPDVAWSVAFNLVELDVEARQGAEAERHWKMAAEQVAKVASPAPATRTALHYERARILRMLDRPGEAAAELKAAAELTKAPEWTWRLDVERGAVEELQGALDDAEASYTRAIGAVEEMRRQLDLDDLKAWLLEAKREPYRRLFGLQARRGEVDRALVTAERALARTLLDALLQAPSPGTPLERAERADAWLREWPALSSAAAPASLEALLAASRGEALLTFFDAPDRVWLSIAVDGRARLHDLGVTPEELGRRIEAFLANVDDPAAAEALGATLFPSEALPRDGRPLAIAAAPLVSRVPFAALRVGGKFLVQRHALRAIPSLTALAAAPPAAGPFAGRIVLGDARGDLGGARDEAALVAAALGTSASTGPEATSARLRAASSAEVLHLAVHSGVGEGAAWLQMADRAVTAHEVLGWHLAPRLVVLSGCASGASAWRERWGSVSAAFCASGARAVVATLRSVDDRAALGVMRAFYRDGAPADPARALAEAQRLAIREGRPASEWGSFVVLGGTR